MTDQTEKIEHEWPTPEQIHGWFGKHPADAKSTEIKALLAAVYDDVGGTPENVYRAMSSHYNDALTNGLCPCGSKATYGGCCKNDWISVTRWRAKAAEEAREARKAEHNEQVAVEDDPVDWKVRVGVSKKGRLLLGATPGHENEGVDPMVMLRMLREATDGLERQIIAEDVLETVFAAMAQAQARAQAGPPQGVPLGPDGKPLLRH